MVYLFPLFENQKNQWYVQILHLPLRYVASNLPLWFNAQIFNVI